MATLILEQDGQRRGALVHGRTVIGRRANSHVVIPDRAVSRVHAWIGRAGHAFFIADSGSRTGTLVNGQPVEGRHSLRDGDEIRIGPATITFFEAATLPPGIEPLLTPADSTSEDGIFVYCECGAPIWAPWDYGGRTARCRQCGGHVALPKRPNGVAPSDPNNDTLADGAPSPFASTETGGVKLVAEAPPKPKPKPKPRKPAQISLKKRPQNGAAKPVPQRVLEPDEPPRTDTICGACQSPISMLEPTTTCPDCGVAFHADCWTENRGCSSYGCKQVGILDPAANVGDTAALHEEGLEAEHPDAMGARRREILAKLDPLRVRFAPIWTRLAPLWAKLDPIWTMLRLMRARFRAVDWGPVLLPGSVLIGLAGVFVFGVPSLAMAIGLVIGSRRRTPRKPTLVAAATIVSTVMAAAGSALSTYWWLCL
ncbi:MAG TPA: FHA domain-containing protein [Tepidisphaeraceae bacterium]|jgi:hypothetical protein